MAEQGRVAVPLTRQRVLLALWSATLAAGAISTILGWNWEHAAIPCPLWLFALWLTLQWGTRDVKKPVPVSPPLHCPKRGVTCGMMDTWVKVGGDLLMVLSGPESDPTITFAGPGFIQDLGWPPEELRGHRWSEFIHPEDLELTLATMRATSPTGQFTHRWRHRQVNNGVTRWVWLEWDIQHIRELNFIYAHARNLTNRFEREAQMATWARITSDLMGTMDTATPVEERKFEWVNEAWTKSLGWTPQELYSMRITDLMDPEQAESIIQEQKHRESVTEPSVITQHECAVLRKGTPATYRTYAWMTANINGMLYVSGRDIDQEAHHREELHKAISDLKIRNADLERFASIAAHQLRSPPRTIAGVVQALQEDYGHLLDAEGLQFLADIRSDADQMAEIVDGLYHFSNVRTRSEMTLERIDLNEVMADIQASKTKKGLLRPQDIIDWGRLPVVWGEKVLLVEVFKNLIQNALKFNESPVKIILVDARRRADQRWDISVQDNGIGIDPKYHHKMFQMFQRMHPGYKGTGVGLALVAAIVQKMGGTISVQSEVGNGTTFIFDLEGTTPPWKGLEGL